MLTLPRLHVMARNGLHVQMVEMVLAARAGVPLPVRARLSDADVAGLAGLGLTLSRMIEVVPRVTAPLLEMLDELVGRVLIGDEGGAVTSPVGEHGGDSPSGVAAALSGLLAAEPLVRRRGPFGEEDAHEHADRMDWLGHAIQQCWHRLARAQSQGPQDSAEIGSIDGQIGDEVDHVIVLWQLGECDDAHMYLDMHAARACSERLGHIVPVLAGLAIDQTVCDILDELDRPESKANGERVIGVGSAA